MNRFWCGLEIHEPHAVPEGTVVGQVLPHERLVHDGDLPRVADVEGDEAAVVSLDAFRKKNG